MTTCGAAIKNFEAKTGEVAAEAKIVKLYCQVPPIAKMDGSLNNLAACEHLQLSTNAIDKFGVALSLPNLKILRFGSDRATPNLSMAFVLSWRCSHAAKLFNEPSIFAMGGTWQ